MAVYSFLNISCSLVGFGVVCELGFGATVADEGISFEMEGDKNTLTMGADGGGMHNLHAAQNGVVAVRLLKTSPTNAILMAAFNAQRINPANWGTNTIVVRDPNRGDMGAASQCAFKRQPVITYAKDGGMNEWRWDAIAIDMLLGIGTPSIL